jgi:hypothetical protein
VLRIAAAASASARRRSRHGQRRRRRAPTVGAAPTRPGGLADNGRGASQRGWQAGTKRIRTVTMTQPDTVLVNLLAYYARLFDEAPEHPVPAEEAIRAARRHFAQERLAV